MKLRKKKRLEVSKQYFITSGTTQLLLPSQNPPAESINKLREMGDVILQVSSKKGNDDTEKLT